MVNLPDLGIDAKTKTFEEGDTFGYNPLSGYDIMSAQDGPIITPNGWSRWVQGWIPDDDVICLDLSKVKTNTFPLGDINQTELGGQTIVIKVTPTEVCVIELRKWDPRFDTEVKANWNGVIAYSVDANLGHQEVPIKLLINRGQLFWVDAVLHAGEMYSSGMLNITLELLRESSAVVTLTKPQHLKH